MNYQMLYKKLNNRTPIGTDCGSLCANACCKDDDGERLGMYLFPGEEAMFEQKDGFFVEQSELKYGDRKADIVYCTPFCNRKERPLSCRIFPLFPYISRQGELLVIIDPRSGGLCPLRHAPEDVFRPSFLRGVMHIGLELMREKQTASFLYSLSRLCDEYDVFQLKSVKMLKNSGRRISMPF